jgi:hypothetical protein
MCDQIKYIVAYVINLRYANDIKQAGYTVAHIIMTLLSQFSGFTLLANLPPLLSLPRLHFSLSAVV